MKAESAAEERLEVDPAALVAASDVLYDVGSQVRQAGVQAQADTIAAARVLDHWDTSASLITLAARWDNELQRMSNEAGKLCNALAKAASDYRAADASSPITVVDNTYIRGQ